MKRNIHASVSAFCITLAALLCVLSVFEKTVPRRLVFVFGGLFSLGIGLVDLLVKTGMDPNKVLVPLALFGAVGLVILFRLDLTKPGQEEKEDKHGKTRALVYFCLAVFFIAADFLTEKSLRMFWILFLVLGVWEFTNLRRNNKRRQEREDLPKSVS